jgi:hypothetical protein
MVYNTREAMNVEASYVLEKHAIEKEGEKEGEKVVIEEVEEDADNSGGEN